MGHLPPELLSFKDRLARQVVCLPVFRGIGPFDFISRLSRQQSGIVDRFRLAEHFNLCDEGFNCVYLKVQL